MSQKLTDRQWIEKGNVSDVCVFSMCTYIYKYLSHVHVYVALINCRAVLYIHVCIHQTEL